MEQEIAYLMACEQGFSPLEFLRTEFNRGQRELENEQSAVEAQLRENVQEMSLQVHGLFQGMLDHHHESTAPARDHVPNLNQSVQDLTKTKERTLELMQRAKQHFTKVVMENKNLRARLRDLQDQLKKKSERGPFDDFLKELGFRTCTLISQGKDT